MSLYNINSTLPIKASTSIHTIQLIFLQDIFFQILFYSLPIAAPFVYPYLDGKATYRFEYSINRHSRTSAPILLESLRFILHYFNLLVTIDPAQTLHIVSAFISCTMLSKLLTHSRCYCCFPSSFRPFSQHILSAFFFCFLVKVNFVILDFIRLSFSTKFHSHNSFHESFSKLEHPLCAVLNYLSRRFVSTNITQMAL